MKNVFDPQVLHRCAQQAVGLQGDAMFEAALRAVDEAYPGLVEVKAPQWIFNNAGGAMGQMHLVYASLTEYIMLFGTPIGTEGHSGRYPVDIWDFMLDGEMWCYTEGETRRHEYRPGDAAFLGRDFVKGYRIPQYGWMLEYGRGVVPAMLPFGIADSLSSTLEWGNIVRLVQTYSRQLVRCYGAKFTKQAKLTDNTTSPQRLSAAENLATENSAWRNVAARNAVSAAHNDASNGV